ncbi:MAG: sortase [Candidatus Portnoybacteria bacterium]|nr:sortase [Candidatus Portnoybacteria bacterium]
MENLSEKNSILGCLPKAFLGNFALGFLALIVGAFWGGPRMAILPETGRTIFFFFFILYGGITIWSIFSMNKKRRINDLQTEGPFKYVRHPMYGAIIFLLNPAMAFLLRSWLLLLAILPIYFIWKKSVSEEEAELTKVFGRKYLNYQASVWPFFPNLFAISKTAFFAGLGLAVFAVLFLILNLPAFYLHWVDWEKEFVVPEFQPIVSELPGPSEEQKPKYDKEDSVVINKINIDAPLVMISGISQKELNQGLNKGVIVYPGSALPDEPGNLFLTGHSSVLPWNKTPYGQVFAQLDRLAPGDRVAVYFQQEKYEYEIVKKEVLPPEKVLLKHQKNAQTLTLMTCWPIGTALRRLVLEGVLIE